MGMSQSYGPNPGDHDDMIDVLRSAVEAGVTFFDTAESYGPYVNEVLPGEALSPLRDELVIATKFGWRIEDGRSVDLNSNPDQIRRVPDESLPANRILPLRHCARSTARGSLARFAGASIRFVGVAPPALAEAPACTERSRRLPE